MKRKFGVQLGVAIVIVMFAVSSVLAGALPKPISKNPEAQKLIDKAWALERTDSNAEIFKQCYTMLEQADKLDPNNTSIITDLSRYYWNYGDNLPKQTPEQKKKLEGIYGQGMAAAERSLKIKETSAAHYWFAVNKAASMEFSSIVTQAAAFPVIYKHYQIVAKTDPNYYYGACGRLWSEILSRVPKKVVEIVGQKYVDEAMVDIDKAIKTEPRYFDNYVYKARFMFVYFGNKEEALKLLDTILKQEPNVFPEEVAANKISQRAGRTLWKQITGKDYPQK